MDPSAVYVRTRLGDEEMRTHAHDLALVQRQVLILVDGHTPLHALLQRWRTLKGLAEALGFLASHGYIAPRDAPASDLPTLGEELPPPAAPASGGGPRAADPEFIRRHLVAWFLARVPRQSERFVSKLQAAPASEDGLLAAVQSCHRLLRLTVDEALADELRDLVRHLLARG
jgi:hypothetical protein